MLTRKNQRERNTIEKTKENYTNEKERNVQLRRMNQKKPTEVFQMSGKAYGCSETHT